VPENGDFERSGSFARCYCLCYHYRSEQADVRNARSTPRPSEKLNKSAADVRSIIQSGRLADLRWPIFSDVWPDVDGFYRSSDFSRKVARKSEVPPFFYLELE
jgi:hypothetical protein